MLLTYVKVTVGEVVLGVMVPMLDQMLFVTLPVLLANAPAGGGEGGGRQTLLAVGATTIWVASMELPVFLPHVTSTL